MNKIPKIKNSLNKYFLFGTFVILLLIINIFLIKKVTQSIIEHPLYILVYSQDLSIVIFIYFTLASYNCFNSLKVSFFDENNIHITNEIKKIYLYQYIKILTLSFIVFLNVLAYDLFVYEVDLAFLVRHIISSNIVNILLVSVLAVTFGLSLSLYFRKLYAYTLVVLVGFLVSPLIQHRPFYDKVIFHFIEVFGILPDYVRWDQMYGIPIEPYRWNLILFWLFFFLVAILIKLFDIKRSLFERYLVIGMVLFSSLSFFNYLNPGSTLREWYHPKGPLGYDLEYYRNTTPKEQSADFTVTSYQLHFSIDDKLHAKARLHLQSDELLDVYKFTLYRDYKVIKVVDNEDKEQDFIQDGDYLEIYNTTKDHAKIINIYYEGYSPKFYSNRQAIFLAGYFPYYPIAGLNSIYDVDKQGFVSTMHDSVKHFDVVIEAPMHMPVYSNLNRVSNNTFKGEAEAVTIVGGFLKDYRVGEYIVYDSIVNMPEEEYLNVLEERLILYKNKVSDNRDYSFKHITQIFRSYLNSSMFSDERIVFFSDHIITLYLDPHFIVTGFMKSHLPESTDKMMLTDILFHYLLDVYVHNRSITSTKANLSELDVELDRPIIIAGLLLERINSLGEDLVLTRVYEYLLNSEDMRDEVTFLMELCD